METSLETLRSTFLEKKEILENAKIQLKNEFIGIDSIIDEVVDVVSSWYTLNFLQDKPLIINLWGLTGVGKTSLITRLAQLIHFGEKFYRFDLGEKSSTMSFYNKIDDLCENRQDEPVIIALDEFQHARTLKNVGGVKEEVETDVNRKVWDLIDSGKMNYYDWKPGIYSFENAIVKLKSLLKENIIIERGIVKSNEELFCNEMNIDREENEPLYFIPKKYYKDIIHYAGEEMKIVLEKELSEVLLKLDGVESVLLLERVLKLARRPAVKHFSKALIVIIGNLDEAFTMSGNFSPDIDADEFHEESLKIKIPKIKSELRSRFRDEQIARLGNIHIIYPALNRAAYTQIIRQDVNRFLDKLAETLSVKIEVKDSLIELLYNEGVYPVQGVRPIFTTNQQLFKSKLNYFISELVEVNQKVTKIEFECDASVLKCNYYKDEKCVSSKELTLSLNLNNLRKNRNDELQTIVAVHESGHAILCGALMHKIPEKVMSVTADFDANGFVYSKNEHNFFSKNEFIPKLSTLLGGYIAEEILFGKENITSGAGSDLTEATEIASKYIKKYGFGDTIACFSKAPDDSSHVIHNIRKIEVQIQEVLLQAKDLATKTLLQEKELLVQMASVLTQKTTLNQTDVKSLFEEYRKFKISTNKSFYRSILQKEMSQLKDKANLLKLDPVRFNSVG